MEYQLDEWKRQDWYSGSRHYLCEVRQNLFGQWVVLRRWGRGECDSGAFYRGFVRLYKDKEGLEIFDAVGQRRTKRAVAFGE